MMDKQEIIKAEQNNKSLTIVYLQRKYYLNYFKSKEIYDIIKKDANEKHNKAT